MTRGAAAWLLGYRLPVILVFFPTVPGRPLVTRPFLSPHGQSWALLRLGAGPSASQGLAFCISEPCGGGVESVNPTSIPLQLTVPLLTAADTQQLTRFPESVPVNSAALQEGGFRAEYLIRA